MFLNIFIVIFHFPFLIQEEKRVWGNWKMMSWCHSQKKRPAYIFCCSQKKKREKKKMSFKWILEWNSDVLFFFLVHRFSCVHEPLLLRKHASSITLHALPVFFFFLSSLDLFCSLGSAVSLVYNRISNTHTHSPTRHPIMHRRNKLTLLWIASLARSE